MAFQAVQVTASGSDRTFKLQEYTQTGTPGAVSPAHTETNPQGNNMVWWEACERYVMWFIRDGRRQLWGAPDGFTPWDRLPGVSSTFGSSAGILLAQPGQDGLLWSVGGGSINYWHYTNRTVDNPQGTFTQGSSFSSVGTVQGGAYQLDLSLFRLPAVRSRLVSGTWYRGKPRLVTAAGTVTTWAPNFTTNTWTQDGESVQLVDDTKTVLDIAASGNTLWATVLSATSDDPVKITAVPYEFA